MSRWEPQSDVSREPDRPARRNERVRQLAREILRYRDAGLLKPTTTYQELFHTILREAGRDDAALTNDALQVLLKDREIRHTPQNITFVGAGFYERIAAHYRSED